MKIVRTILDKLYAIKPLNYAFKPVLDAADAAMFGTDETTVTAPHAVTYVESKRFMGVVIAALAPAALASVVFYGLRAVYLFAVSYIVGGLVEILFARFRNKHIHEGFLVTGLIFPLTLPPETPLWIVGVGVFFGTFFGKERTLVGWWSLF